MKGTLEIFRLALVGVESRRRWAAHTGSNEKDRVMSSRSPCFSRGDLNWSKLGVDVLNPPPPRIPPVEEASPGAATTPPGLAAVPGAPAGWVLGLASRPVAGLLLLAAAEALMLLLLLLLPPCFRSDNCRT